MAKEIINLNGIGGFAPRFFGNKSYDIPHPEQITLGNDDQYADGIVNPISKLGYLSPANNTTQNVTITDNPFHGIPRATIVDTINNEFYIGAEAHIYKMTSLTGLLFGVDSAVTDEIRYPETITVTDFEIYTLNGVRQLFYSYRRDSDNSGDVGAYPLTGTGWNDDWLSADCNGAFELGENQIVLTLADNGFMYILDGSALHKVDGTVNGGANGTVTPNVLLFPATFQLLDALDLKGMLWIAIIRSTGDITYGTYSTVATNNYCGVYVWDRQSTQVTMTDFIPIEGVREIRNIFSFRGVPACFTVSNTRYTQLRIYDGNEFKIVQELGFQAYPRFKDSLCNNGETITWLSNNGIVYTYGSSEPGMNDALYKIGDMTGHITAEKTFSYAGAILGVNSSESCSTGYNPTPQAYYLGLRDSTATDYKYLVRRWHPYSVNLSAGTQYPLAGGFYSIIKMLPKLSFVKAITINFLPESYASSSTEVLDIDIYFNQSSTSWGTTTLTRADASRGYKYIPIGKSGVNSVQIGLNWKTANSLTYSINTTFAEIDYNLKTKKI